MSDRVTASLKNETTLQEHGLCSLHKHDVVDLNKLLRCSFNSHTKSRANFILRSDVLPVVCGALRVFQSLFTLIGNIIANHCYSAGPLFLYVKCSWGGSSPDLNRYNTCGEEQFVVEFHSSLPKHDDWILSCEALMSEAVSLARQVNVIFSFHPSVNNGKLFSLTFLGKSD